MFHEILDNLRKARAFRGANPDFSGAIRLYPSAIKGVTQMGD
jgi:hypothetical protein